MESLFGVPVSREWQIGALLGICVLFSGFFQPAYRGQPDNGRGNKKREGRTAFPRGGLKSWPDVRGAVYPETFVCPYRIRMKFSSNTYLS